MHRESGFGSGAPRRRDARDARERKVAPVGYDDHHGERAAPLPDRGQAHHWSLQAVVRAGRPHHLEVSPDRAQVVFVLDEDVADLWTIASPGRAPERLTAGRALAGVDTDSAPSWSPDGQTIAFTDRGRVQTVDVGSGAITDLVAGADPVWIDTRRLVATVEHEGNATLCTFAVDDPWPRAIGRAPGDYGRAVPSPDGRFVAVPFRPAGEPGCRELRIVDVERGEERVLSGAPEVDTSDPVWSPDGRAIAFLSDRSGWREVHLLELTDTSRRVDRIGVAEHQLTADGADFGELTWDRVSGRILGTRARGGTTDVVTIDPATRWVELVAAGGTWSSPRWFATGVGDRPTSPDHEEDGTRDEDGLVVLAVHESATTPPGVVRITPGGHPNESIFRAAPRVVDAAPHVASVGVSFPSEDGTVVHGRLFRPSGASPNRPVPLVVAVSDAPGTAAGDQWDGLAQYFVDKGYGWLTPAYRGSRGYGRDFERLAHGGCGIDDAADCLFAGEYAAKLDWVDDERIVVFGRGYGGFLALSVLTRDPGRRFAAGVSVNGDSDLLSSWARCDTRRRRELEATMGHPSAYRDAYRAASVLHRLDALPAPVLVVHGELDTRAPFESSRRLVERLARADATYEYVTYPNEGHVFADVEVRLHAARRVERFVDWHVL